MKPLSASTVQSPAADALPGGLWSSSGTRPAPQAALPDRPALALPAGGGQPAALSAHFHGIGRRLLLAILLFSSAVTLVLTALQLYLDYDRDLNTLQARVREITSGYHDSLARSLWNVDAEQIRVQLEGIMRLPDLRSASVVENPAPGVKAPLQVSLGHSGSGNAMVWKVPLVYTDRSGPRTLGVLTLEATLDEVYRRLRDKTLVILVTQAIKTFVVSMFILFIVHQLITRHLVALAGHLDAMDPHRGFTRLALRRRSRGARQDELDRVVGAFNGMVGQLERSYDDLREVNLALQRDITARRSAEAEAARLAFHDALTDLPNRRSLLDKLHQESTMAARLDRHGALLFVGLDHFKQLNDALGHAMGDALLVEVARRLQRVLRRTDLVARLGGDEFAVLLLGLGRDADTAARAALEMTDKLRSALRAPYELEGQRLHVTASIGIALLPADAAEAEALMRHADTALHHAKSDGRDSVHFFQPAMHSAVLTQHELENDLRQALVEQQLSLAFQPLVNSDGRLVGTEALLRWRHPRRGDVPPNDFIPVAEASNLIIDVGDWVLAAAARQLRQWQEQAPDRDFHLSVNISPRQFQQHDFDQRVRRIVEGAGADPRRLVLEITEGVLVRDSAAAAAKMQALRQMGVRIFIDDFGTGYSSLAYLKRLPVDGLKIDQSFVRDLVSDPNDAAIVETVLAVAQRFELQVVAEGVETAEQLVYLEAHRCRYFQGFYFSRPLPAADFNRQYLVPAGV
ncbi:MAG: EAL domain-containing protein [Pseudomonadota bacterium]